LLIGFYQILQQTSIVGRRINRNKVKFSLGGYHFTLPLPILFDFSLPNSIDWDKIVNNLLR
jgi:hypothetical protein